MNKAGSECPALEGIFLNDPSGTTARNPLRISVLLASEMLLARSCADHKSLGDAATLLGTPAHQARLSACWPLSEVWTTV